MTPTKEQIKQHLSRALQRCLDAYALLEDKHWKKKASGNWTTKEFLAHAVATQEEVANRLIQQALAGEPGQIPGYDNRKAINDYNELMLATVRDLPASELMDRYKAAVEGCLQTLDGLSEADLDKPASSPGWDCQGTVRDLFLGGFLHLAGHYQDIRRVAKKKLPHWMEAGTPDEVNFHLGRIFHYMPLIFWPERGGDMKATFLFTIEGDGGGQWAVRVDGGKAETQDGAPDSFDMELRTKPELWVDLSTGELNAMWAITTRKVHLGGNAGLAMKLDQLFQVSE